MNENESIFDENAINHFYTDVLKHFLPNARHKSLSHFGSPNTKRASNIGFDLADSNDINLKSDYFYTKKYSFIHYTSIPVLLNIIKEKKIRLYNLHGMDDKEEFEVSLKYLPKDLSDYDVSEIKKNIFCLSMCEEDLEEKSQSLANWRNYGLDGNGVGILISFNKRFAKDWVHFLLSKVYYDEKYLRKFIKINNNYSSFRTEYNLSFNNFDEIFYKYFAFHKSNIYSSEKEVRLLYCQGFESFQKPPVKYDINRRNEKTSYIELEIEWEWDKKTKEFITKQGIIPKLVRPVITIDKIILGYRLSNKAKWDIAEVLQASATNFKKKFKIEDSQLFEHFKPRQL